MMINSRNLRGKALIEYKKSLKLNDLQRKKKYFTLNTHNFPLEDQKVLMAAIKHKFQINCKIYKDRSKYYLMTRDLNKCKDVVKPYILPCFYYKINWR